MGSPAKLIKAQGPARRSTPVAATTAQSGLTGVIGVIPTTGGNFVAQLEADTANRTFVLLAGVLYPLRVKSIDVTSAIAVHLLHES